jgi:CRP/FNR family transcriptional regulator, cyclic AMP receptor protein
MAKPSRTFNPKTFLTTAGLGRKMLSFRKGETIFAQGETADALFVIQKGRAQVSVRSHAGKEATLDILSDGDFVGNDSIAGHTSRTASATATTECSLLRIERKTMLQALTRQVELANLFWRYVLVRNLRYQQDLVDQLCNRSEKRLARILLLLAHFDGHAAPDATIPQISHETLAEMVGTTRSRVCFFMKKFKDSGFIDYGHKGKLLQVHRTLFAFCEQ